MTDLVDVYDEYRTDPAFDLLRRPGAGIRLVGGEGAERGALAMVVGEAPGATENTQGRPFVGASGRVLRQCMELAGLRVDGERIVSGNDRPANAFITNVVKYRPPGNRTPLLPEIAASLPYLRQEWAAIGRPRTIVACGGVAKIAFLPEAGAVTQLIGRPHELADGRTTLWVMYHPSFILRQKSDTVREAYESNWEVLGKWLAQTTRGNT